VDCNVAYEQLARFAAGELDSEEARTIEEHMGSCGACRRRLEALEEADAALSALQRMEPSASAVLNTRRLLSREIRPAEEPEIMTLDDVADFLRISLDELEEVVLELPAFELAGQLRVRRSKLVEWVEARERSYARSRAETEVARILSSAS
jgi:hypothetical protein